MYGKHERFVKIQNAKERYAYIWVQTMWMERIMHFIIFILQISAEYTSHGRQ